MELSWLQNSLIMLVGSVVLYLSIRKSKELGLSTSIQFLSQYLVSTVFVLAALAISGISVIIPLWQILIILSISIFVTYVSNKTSLKALSLSPNPGLSLSIQKSYVVLTTIFAAIFMNSQFEIKDYLAILAIVIATYFIGKKDKANEAKQDNNWLIYSFITFVGFGSLSLLETYVVRELLVHSLVLTFWARTTLISLELLNRYRKGEKLVFEKGYNYKTILIVLSIAIGHFLFSYFMKEGYRTAPNPGYVSAINLASIAIITLLSSAIFKDKLDVKQWGAIATIITSTIIMYI